jgi:hypothetical protein
MHSTLVLISTKSNLSFKKALTELQPLLIRLHYHKVAQPVCYVGSVPI